MPLPLLAIISGLASVVPAVADWIKGPKAAKRAEEIAGVVKAVTGIADPVEGVAAIVQDPALAAEFKVKIAEIGLEYYREDTKRQEIVNQTMRVEYESKGVFKTGWRAFLGWCFSVGLGFFLVAPVVAWLWLVFKEPGQLDDVLKSLTELVQAMSDPILYTAAVLGVLVKKRSDDKDAAAGTVRPGILGNVFGRIAKGG